MPSPIAGPETATKNMREVPAGTFRMGSDRFYPEERPVRPVHVDAFWIDEHPVTVAEFRRFAKATGHVTEAERAPTLEQYPDADPELLAPGSLVFAPTPGPVSFTNPFVWWSWCLGADWRHPEGPDSTLDGRDRHPVTHVTHGDAAAYAAWAGKALPTEAEWECAARGGLDGADFAWGDEHEPKGRRPANTWQGRFPYDDAKPEGKRGTSPVGSYPPNGYGLVDMAGNVWEWTDDFFAAHPAAADTACCIPRNPRGPAAEDSLVPDQPGADIPRRVIKGGSHLCAPEYCLRYRPAARQGEAIDTSTSHIGFRCVVRDG